MVVGHIVDILSNITSVILFSARKIESKKLMAQLNQYVVADQIRDWWFLFMFLFQGASFVVYQTLSFILLILGFKNGTVTAGDFALITSINISIINILWSLSEDTLQFSETTSDIE